MNQTKQTPQGVPDSRNRSRRHTTVTVRRAQEMAEAGWTAHEIQQQLIKIGTPVTWATVKAWIDPEYRSRRNHTSTEDKRRWRDVSGDHVKARMLELAERGLSDKAISVVVEIYHGRQISEHMIARYRRSQADRQKAAA